jgi:hypothetical protein
MSCNHMEFKAAVVTHRSDDKPTKFHLEIRVECTECHTPFHFIGPKLGKLITADKLSTNDAMVTSIDGCELRVPIAMGPRPIGPKAIG